MTEKPKPTVCPHCRAESVAVHTCDRTKSPEMVTVPKAEWEAIGCVLALARRVCESPTEGSGREVASLREAGKALDAARASPAAPGMTCPKTPHDSRLTGYLHAEDDDSPYDMDGVWYCGRCHCLWNFLTRKCEHPAAPVETKPTDEQATLIEADIERGIKEGSLVTVPKAEWEAMRQIEKTARTVEDSNVGPPYSEEYDDREAYLQASEAWWALVAALNVARASPAAPVEAKPSDEKTVLAETDIECGIKQRIKQGTLVIVHYKAWDAATDAIDVVRHIKNEIDHSKVIDRYDAARQRGGAP